MDNQLSLFDMVCNDAEDEELLNTENTSSNEIQTNEPIKNENEVVHRELELSKEKDDFYLGQNVIVEYGGVIYPAVVKHIYNNGESINCSFNGKYTSFHISKVSKLD